MVHEANRGTWQLLHIIQWYITHKSAKIIDYSLLYAALVDDSKKILADSSEGIAGMRYRSARRG
jgi:hypothetical protein